MGVCEQDKTDARPLESKPNVSFEKLLQAVSLGNTEEEVLTSIAGRLARMEHRITKEDDQAIVKTSGGLSLKELSRQVLAAVDPDRQETQAKKQFGTATPSENQRQQAAVKLIQEALQPPSQSEAPATLGGDQKEKRTDYRSRQQRSYP